MIFNDPDSTSVATQSNGFRMCTMRDRFIRKDDLSPRHVMQGAEKSSCCRFRNEDGSRTAEICQAGFSHVLTSPLSPPPKAGLRVKHGLIFCWCLESLDPTEWSWLLFCGLLNLFCLNANGQMWTLCPAIICAFSSSSLSCF